MKWLTKERINEAAANGTDKDVFACVVEHWTQLATATPRELKIGLTKGRVSISSAHCAFCIKVKTKCGYTKCADCLLVKFSSHCGDLGWCEATKALDKWEELPTKANFLKWQRAARKLLNNIKKAAKKCQ